MINPSPTSLLAPYNTSITFLQRTPAMLSCHDALASCIRDVAVISYSHHTHLWEYSSGHGLLRPLIARTHCIIYLFDYCTTFTTPLIRVTTPSPSPLFDQPRCTATTTSDMHIILSTELKYCCCIMSSRALRSFTAIATEEAYDHHHIPFATLLITTYTFPSYPLRCLFLLSLSLSLTGSIISHPSYTPLHQSLISSASLPRRHNAFYCIVGSLTSSLPCFRIFFSHVSPLHLNDHTFITLPHTT